MCLPICTSKPCVLKPGQKSLFTLHPLTLQCACLGALNTMRAQPRTKSPHHTARATLLSTYQFALIHPARAYPDAQNPGSNFKSPCYHATNPAMRLPFCTYHPACATKDKKSPSPCACNPVHAYHFALNTLHVQPCAHNPG